MNRHIYTHIKQLGLSDNLSSVYAYLLEQGGAAPSTIASKLNMNRTSVYRLLTDLSIKGLIIETKRKNKLYYKVSPPRSLLNYTKTQVRLAEERDQKAINIFDDIEAIYKSLPHKPTVRFFEGFDNLISIFDDVFYQEGSYEILVLGNIVDLEKDISSKKLEEHLEEIYTKGLSIRGIYSDENREEGVTQLYREKTKTDFPKQAKYLSKEQFPYTSQILLYGEDRVSLMNAHEHTAMGIIIEDKVLYQMIKLLFDLSWNSIS
ncbi:hypothetical protein KKG22_02250 [Patescibacteria group bacterium]|nr:hypothetical protein [Patescibacteria group bacterium]MBU1721826.1 hypothetical protein [Patescibacteria group bacterium]MBU1901679.1 hypothetical protein [Patescibacteria group bacterium]